MTGKRKWHYQLVHIGIWDMDIPDAPILADIVVNGKPIKAVAQRQSRAGSTSRSRNRRACGRSWSEGRAGTFPAMVLAAHPSRPKPQAYDRQGAFVDTSSISAGAQGRRMRSSPRATDRSDLTPPWSAPWPSPVATYVPSATGGAKLARGGSFIPNQDALRLIRRRRSRSSFGAG